MNQNQLPPVPTSPSVPTQAPAELPAVPELTPIERWVNLQKRIAKLKRNEQELRPEIIKDIANPNLGKPGHPNSETINNEFGKFAVNIPKKWETHKDEAANAFIEGLPEAWREELVEVSYKFKKDALNRLEQKAILDTDDAQGYRSLWEAVQQHFTIKTGMSSLTLKSEPEK